jgi:hypothetical protein
MSVEIAKQVEFSDIRRSELKNELQQLWMILDGNCIRHFWKYEWVLIPLVFIICFFCHMFLSVENHVYSFEIKSKKNNVMFLL